MRRVLAARTTITRLFTNRDVMPSAPLAGAYVTPLRVQRHRRRMRRRDSGCAAASEDMLAATTLPYPPPAASVISPSR